MNTLLTGPNVGTELHFIAAAMHCGHQVHLIDNNPRNHLYTHLLHQIPYYDLMGKEHLLPEIMEWMGTDAFLRPASKQIILKNLHQVEGNEEVGTPEALYLMLNSQQIQASILEWSIQWVMHRTQMPIYLYNIGKDRWVQWERNLQGWEAIGLPPEFPPCYTAIGSKVITHLAVDRINELYEETS